MHSDTVGAIATQARKTTEQVMDKVNALIYAHGFNRVVAIDSPGDDHALQLQPHAADILRCHYDIPNALEISG
jgi:hypothetical protein